MDQMSNFFDSSDLEVFKTYKLYKFWLTAGLFIILLYNLFFIQYNPIIESFFLLPYQNIWIFKNIAMFFKRMNAECNIFNDNEKGLNYFLFKRVFSVKAFVRLTFLY